VVMAANGRFSIVVLALRDIAPSEELTFDYHSVTESAEEQKNAICFCGWSSCRGRYVNYAGPDTFQQVIGSHHGVCERTSLLIKACSLPLTDNDRERLRKYRLLGAVGSLVRLSFSPVSDVACGFQVMRDCPDWLLKFASLVLEFVEFEKVALPRELMKLRRYGYTKETAEFDTIGVTEGRIQSLAIAIVCIGFHRVRLYGLDCLLPRRTRSSMFFGSPDKCRNRPSLSSPMKKCLSVSGTRMIP
jgi:hypothetical protein